MKDIRLEKLARLIVEYSTKIKKDDKIFIKGDDCSIPFITAVAEAAIKKGAHVTPIINIPEITESKLKYGTDEQILNGNRLFALSIDEGDVFINAFSKKNTRNLSEVNADKISLNAKADKDTQIKYMKRIADGSLRWNISPFPTHADAQEANMSLSDYEEFVYSACHLNSEDPVSEWKKIRDYQEKWCKYLDTKNTIRILSKDTDVRVNVKGRSWQNCCGLVNMPDGEIYTSPVENDINGHIRFSYPGIFSGRVIENIFIEIENGKVIKATADKGQDLLHALLDTDQGSRYFGEVAIGTNYEIRKFTRNMLFDEKIGGTIHMAVGASLAEAGGKNESSIHWDMLCDMKNGGTITADDELIYKDGHLIDDLLK